MFGDILRDSRQKQSIDLQTVSRQLRIRPDIIRAIEESDIERMPAKSYSTNMINAYAKLLKINPEPLIKEYQSIVYSNEVTSERSHSSRASMNDRYEMSAESRKIKYREARLARDERVNDYSRLEKRNDSNRAQYSIYDEIEDVKTKDRARRQAEILDSEQTTSERRQNAPQKKSYKKSTHSSLPDKSYNNAVEGRRPRKRKIFGFVGIIAVVLLVIFGITRIVSCSNSSNNTTSSNSGVAVSGLTDPENNGISTTTQTTTTPIQPTAAVFSYEISKDLSAYIEIYENGSTSPSVAGTMQGPTHDTFDVTGTLQFVTTAPDAVKLTLGGEEVFPEDKKGSGVYTYDVNFSEYIETWKREHLTPTESTNS